MRLMSYTTGILCAVAVSLGDGAHGQAFPSKTVRIVTVAAGGSVDIGARLIAQGISGPLGQNVIIDNRVGGTISGEIVARAQPDGHTLLATSSIHWIGPLMSKTPYDPVRDFSAITLAMLSPNILAVNPGVAAGTVKELISLAKARPGELNYSSAGAGGSPHLAAELFNAMAGVHIVRIAYKGGGQAVNAVLANEVQMMFSPAISVIPHMKSGKLRALAVTTARPSVLAPGLPAMAETLPGYESAQTTGLFAPARTPASIISRLNEECVKFLSRADIKEKLLGAGVESVGSSPREFDIVVKSEISRMGKVIKSAGIRED